MIKEQIEKIFDTFPGSLPKSSEAKKTREAIIVLARALDRQNEEMVTVYKVAQKIMVAIGKLDEKFEKAGL